MNIDEWFDVENEEHIEAYRYLITCGTWPVGLNGKSFIPDGIEMPPQWQVQIAMKLAIAYAKGFSTNVSNQKVVDSLEEYRKICCNY